MYSAKYKPRTTVPLVDFMHSFYEGLTALHFVRCPGDDSSKEGWVTLAKKAISSFELWAEHSTWNWENKLLLLQAEWHFAEGESEKAIEKYKAAIDSARRHRFVHEEGLANELFSTFNDRNGDIDAAKIHLSEARSCYVKWGATALVERLDASKQFAN